MAKYVIKDLSAKQIEQVLVTSYHALSKPLLIYPTLSSLEAHVELELRPGTEIHKLKQISSADGKVVIPYDECHIGDSLFILNGIQLDEYKLARKNPSVDLPIIGTDETNGFLYLICSTSLSIAAGVALDSNTFAFPTELQEASSNFFNFLQQLNALIENGTLLHNTTYYGNAHWESAYMPTITPYEVEGAPTPLESGELAVHILYDDYGVNLEITTFKGTDMSCRSWMMSIPTAYLRDYSHQEVYH